MTLTAGAITIDQSATPSFEGCTFKNNYALDTDGGLEGGGAIWFRNPNSKAQLEATVVFKKTKFLDNYVQVEHSGYGGAVYSRRSAEFINCLFVGNYAISGYGASSGDGHEAYGGAIFSQPTWWNNNDYETGTLKIINCTFHGNYTDVKTSNGTSGRSTISYGQWDDVRTETYIFNTIISGNKTLRQGASYSSGDEDNEIIGAGRDTPKLNIGYSNVVGSTGQDWVESHIYDINPVYNDTANGDYSLSAESPLIGMGLASWSSQDLDAPTVDLLGNSRPTTNWNLAAATRGPDLGAYEHSDDVSSAPLPVTGLTGEPVTNGAKLTWSANDASLTSTTDATDIKRYEVHQLYNSSYVPVDSVTTNTATIKKYWDGTELVSNLVHGTAYTFKVRAVNTSDVAGGFSDTEVVTPEFKGPKWYVSTSGSSTSEGSSTAPLSHLDGAIEKAASGDTIVVLKGTHSGSNNRGINFDASKPIVIMGDPSYPADSTIIDAGGRDRHFCI